VTIQRSGLLKNRERWSDIDPKFKTDARGNIAIAYEVNAVFSSIDNILFTYKRERPMRPNLFSSLRSLVFQHVDKAEAVSTANEIKDLLESNDNRIRVNTVSFKTSPDQLVIGVDIWIVIKGFSTPQLFQKTFV
jgi:phage baseplate assembly protein W